jgi:hypothetical protein
MAAFIGWLSSPNGIAATGAFAWLALVIAGRYAPQTPFWDGVRSFLTDYAQRNLKALPANVAARIESEDGALVVVLSVDGADVKRLKPAVKP